MHLISYLKIALFILSVSQFTTALGSDVEFDKDLANIFQAEQRTLHCERYKKLNDFYQSLPDPDVERHLTNEIGATSLLLRSEDLSFQERKMLSSQKRILKKLLKYRNKKDGVKVFKEKVCTASQWTLRHSWRGLGWMSAGIMTAAITPVESIGKLTRGLVTGEVRDGRGDLYYDFIGPRLYQGVGGNLLFSQRYLKLALAQPWLFPILAAPVIDAEVMKICKRKHSLRADEVKFCNNFLGFKEDAVKISKSFERLGANIHNSFSNTSKAPIKDEDPYTQEEILKDLTKLTNENFCQEMVEIGKKFKKSKREIRAKSNLETWRLGTNPERYGMPEILDFKTSEENHVKLPARAPLRNVIISLGPSEDHLEEGSRKKLVKEYRARFRKLKKQLKVGRKIFQNADTVEECEKLKRKHRFNYEEFEALAMEVDKDETGRKLFENHKIKSMFKSVKGLVPFLSSTKLHWEFIDAGDVRTVDQLLRSKDVGNVILVMHGTEKGKLIDSNNSEIPRTFFSNLSPSIMSINFFSCFSQKIDGYYGISKELLKNKSAHANRHLTFVELDPSYSYKAGQVPFEAFPGFLTKVDFFLEKSLRGNSLYQSLNSKIQSTDSVNQCGLKIKDLGQIKTTFSVTINNKQVGIVSGKSSEFDFSFDCSILKSEENVLRLLNIGLSTKEALTVDLSQFVLSNESLETVLESPTLNVIRLENKVLGITATFSLPEQINTTRPVEDISEPAI